MAAPSEQADQSFEPSHRENGNRQRPIQLRHASDDRVVVTPEDLDRFVMTSAEAVRACTSHEMSKQLMRHLQARFTELVTRILEWCDERDEVAAAAIMQDDDGYVCEIATTGPKRYLDLDDAIYALETELAGEFPEFPFVVRSLPYIDPPVWTSDRCARERIVEIYAKSA